MGKKEKEQKTKVTKEKTERKKWEITFNSPAMLGLVFLCFLVTLAGEITKMDSTRQLFMIYHSSPSDPLTYVRLFSHVLGHAGWPHFIGNASYLLLLGPMLEQRYGWKVIMELTLITGLVTGLIQYFAFPGIALCGASGIVFACIMLSSFTEFCEHEIPVTFILVGIVYLGQQVYDAIVVDNNVSNMAHIVGGLLGAIVGYEINKKGKPPKK